MLKVNDLNCSLYGISHHDPDLFISSDEIEIELASVYDRLKLPYGRIEMQTGIRTRGIYEDKLPSDISTMAAKKLFKEYDIDKSEIDLIIHASVCRNFLEPSTVSVVHHELGLSANCLSFDLSNACLGVMSAITVANDMISSGRVRKALIVTGENSGPLLKKTISTLKEDKSINRKTIKKYFANFTIGSAGVALCLGPATSEKPLFKKSFSLSDTSAYKLCQGDGSTDSLQMETDSEALMHAGIELAKINWGQMKEAFDGASIDHYICHQVGIHHRNFMYQSLELDLAKDQMSFDRYGNTGSAALPLTLSLAVQKKVLKINDRICLLGIGSGLHTQMTELEWN